MSMERNEARRLRDVRGWFSANDFVPDSPRLVWVLAVNRKGYASMVPARFAGGRWRFITPSQRTRGPESVRAWTNLPWCNLHEIQTQQAASSASPAGTKARLEGEAEAQAKDGANWGLSPEETRFDEEA